MRALLFSSFCCLIALTGCKSHRVIHSETPQLNKADLAVKHHYKIPKKVPPNAPLARFQDPQLTQLVAIAIHDSPDMNSAKARIDEARQLARGAYSALWPSAAVDGYLATDHFSFQGVVPPQLNGLMFTRLNNADINLNLKYEVDFWGKNRENLASRLNQTFAAQMDMEETRLLLSAAVASSYFQLQNNLIQLQLAKENTRLMQELQSIVVDRAKQGIESDIPVKTAISNTQAARLSIEDYKRATQQSRNQLAVLMGKNPFNTQIETTRFVYKKEQLKIPDVIPANILARRPDINAARALAESAAHQINVARTAFYPNINLSGVLSAQSLYFSRLFNLRFETEGAKAAVDLPIFDAGARRAHLGAKQAVFEGAVSQYNKTLLNALHEATDDLSALHTLNKQVADQSNALHSTEGNYKLFRSRYSQGIIDYVQLIEIKQVLLQQKATLYSLQTRQKQTLVALLTALGGEVNS